MKTDIEKLHAAMPATKEARGRLERILALGLKPRLTRAEQAEYERLTTEHDEWRRITRATKRAFAEAFDLY